MIRTAPAAPQSATPTTAPLTVAEARALTDRIRGAAETLSALLLEAYSRGAWTALGYASWREYATAELSISQSRAYQLLDHAKVVSAIQAAAGDISTMVETGGDRISTVVEITEREARDLKPQLEAVTDEVRTRVARGEQPAEAVRAVVDSVRSELHPPEAKDDSGGEGDFDLTAELERLDNQVRQLEREVDALSASDLGAEVRQWTEKYARLEGRLQQEIATSREAQRQAKYYGELLKQIRSTLGVAQTQQILPRLSELLQEVGR